MHVFYGRRCYNGRDNNIKMLHISILRTLIEISWIDPPQHFLWADTLATSASWRIHHFSYPRNHGSIHSRGDRIFSCTQCPPSLLFSGYKGPFSQGQSSRSVKLIIWDLQLVPRLRLRGAKLKLLHMPSWLSQEHLYLHLSNFIAQTYCNWN